MKRFYLTLAATVLISGSVQAADIGRDVRRGSNGPDYSNGGYLEFGIGVTLRDYDRDSRSQAPLGFNINLAGAYRYKRFFFESSYGSDGLTLGYSAWNNDRWAIDLIGSSAKGFIAPGETDIDYANSSDAERELAVLDRNTFYNGAGVRVTGYFGNTIFQYRLVSDIHKNNGVTSSVRLGYSRQLRNWNFHSVVSANYASRKTSQYWYGVSEEEASERFPKNNIGTTIKYVGEVGVTYPVTEKIVFRSTAFYQKIDEKMAIKGNQLNGTVNATISYVF